MKKINRATYNPTAAREIQLLCELIYDVFDRFEGITWSRRLYEEIGFYFRDKVTKSSAFLGIWFESWVEFQVPLCIVIDYRGKAPVEKHLQIRKLIEDRKEAGLEFKDYRDFAVILVGFEFLTFEESDVDRLADLFETLYEIAEIKD